MVTSLPYNYKPKITGGFCSGIERAARLDQLTTAEIHRRIYSLDSSNPALLLVDLREADAGLEAAEKALHLAHLKREAKIKELEKDLVEYWTRNELRKAKIVIP